MKTFLVLTVSIISFSLVILGVSSDIEGLTGYNIVKSIESKAPYSYIILFFLMVIMYLVAYIKKLRVNKSNQSSNLNNNTLSAMDISILDDLFDAFSGSSMHAFFDFLLDTRSVNINQAANFDEAIKKFLSPHKKLRNRKLEKAKGEFLRGFEGFLLYSTQFHSFNGVTVRFKFNSEKEEEKYLQYIKVLYKQWSDFLEKVAKEAPNYNFKD
ncbi:hypothetical protein ACIQZM_18575 [Peribacillus sp. NPDC097206]|uniref:hypothetical protein n=1 Tax=Peribacillus sp. NPDC097206 TaxID=3364398 RepID=UPI0038007F73